MKILVPMLSGSTHPDGVMRHAINLARCLLLRPEVTEVYLALGVWQTASVHTLLSEQDHRLHLSTVSTANSAIGRNLWYISGLPALARSLQPDLIHMAYPAPVHRAAYGCPVVTTLHDLYPWDERRNFGYPLVYFNRLVLSRCLHAVDGIACVSNSTYERLAYRYPTHHRKAVCVFNCVEPCALAVVQDEPWMLSLDDTPFLLVVAQHRHNKNLLLSVDILQRMRRDNPSLRLVIVGNTGPESHKLQARLRKLNLESTVMLLHRITDAQLQWSYRHAAALLATSSNEGFGLPVAEAMLAGCPVVCSDIPAFRELVQDRAVLIPHTQDEVEHFAFALERTLAQPRPLPQALPQLGAASIALQYLQLYRGLLHGQQFAPAASSACNQTEGGLS